MYDKVLNNVLRSLLKITLLFSKVSCEINSFMILLVKIILKIHIKAKKIKTNKKEQNQKQMKCNENCDM